MVSSEPTVPNVPFGHAVQFENVSPVPDEYVPASHCVHCDAEDIEPNWPGGHGVQLLALPVEYCPVPHDGQTVEPVLEVYAPAAHGVHTAAP